jgi:hypothetical protein
MGEELHVLMGRCLSIQVPLNHLQEPWALCEAAYLQPESREVQAVLVGWPVTINSFIICKKASDREVGCWTKLFLHFLKCND